jgi:hypothetical protein
MSDTLRFHIHDSDTEDFSVDNVLEDNGCSDEDSFENLEMIMIQVLYL